MNLPKICVPNRLLCLGGTFLITACAIPPGTVPPATTGTKPNTLVVQAAETDSLQDLFSSPDFIERLLPSEEFGDVRVVSRPADELANGQTRVVVVKRTVKKRVPRPQPREVQIAVTPPASATVAADDQATAALRQGTQLAKPYETESMRRSTSPTTSQAPEQKPQNTAPLSELVARQPELKSTSSTQPTAQTSQRPAATSKQPLLKAAAEPPAVDQTAQSTQTAAARTTSVKLDGLKQNKAIWPLPSKPANTFGGKSPDGQAWRGLMFKAKAGQPVKAIADGKVVFAQGLRGYGNLIIVDHGRQFTSIYGYNEALNKRVGQNVSAGDTIAITGNSGPLVDDGLYFEVRHKGVPINPSLYLMSSSASM